MADIIELRVRGRPAGRANQDPAVAGSAQILLFTGVRYERHQDQPKPPAKSEAGGRRSQRKRDRLEIVD
jgi:hypothetical protein